MLIYLVAILDKQLHGFNGINDTSWQNSEKAKSFLKRLNSSMIKFKLQHSFNFCYFSKNYHHTSINHHALWLPQYIVVSIDLFLLVPIQNNIHKTIFNYSYYVPFV